MAKRTPAYSADASTCPPGWTWLLAGVLIGIFISFLYYLTQIAPYDQTSEAIESPQATPMSLETSSQPVAMPDNNLPVVEEAMIPINALSNDSAVVEPNFDFYEQLPNDGADNTPVATTVSTMPEVNLPPVETPPPTKTYLLQVGSFREHQQAEGLKAHLALLGIASQVLKVDLDGVAWHRVQVGPFNDINTLTQMQQRLAVEQISSLVLNP